MDVESIATRLDYAVEHSMVTDWDKQSLDELLEELFPDSEDLQVARALTPSLRQ